MDRNFNDDIYELKERLRIKEKLLTLRDMSLIELDKKRMNKDELFKILKKEERDVTKLENGNFSSIFLSLIGKKEDKLDKEREEYLSAKLRYESSLESIEELETEIEYINGQLLKYKTVNEDYANAIRERQSSILNVDGEKSRRLKEALETVDNLKLDIKEVKEAISAGEKCDLTILEMKNQLNSARDWGVWDMLGGGLISNIAKHSAIDKANDISNNAQHLLKSFEKELSDVNEFTDLGINLSGFTTFADFFFDGFFVDWFVQSKIKDSIDSVNNIHDKINEILSDLNNNLNDLEQNLAATESKIKDILEN